MNLLLLNLETKFDASITEVSMFRHIISKQRRTNHNHNYNFHHMIVQCTIIQVHAVDNITLQINFIIIVYCMMQYVTSCSSFFEVLSLLFHTCHIIPDHSSFRRLLPLRYFAHSLTIVVDVDWPISLSQSIVSLFLALSIFDPRKNQTGGSDHWEREHLQRHSHLFQLFEPQWVRFCGIQ